LVVAVSEPGSFGTAEAKLELGSTPPWPVNAGTPLMPPATTAFAVAPVKGAGSSAPATRRRAREADVPDGGAVMLLRDAPR